MVGCTILKIEAFGVLRFPLVWEPPIPWLKLGLQASNLKDSKLGNLGRDGFGLRCTGSNT